MTFRRAIRTAQVEATRAGAGLCTVEDVLVGMLAAWMLGKAFGLDDQVPDTDEELLAAVAPMAAYRRASARHVEARLRTSRGCGRAFDRRPPRCGAARVTDRSPGEPDDHTQLQVRGGRPRGTRPCVEVEAM